MKINITFSREETYALLSALKSVDSKYNIIRNRKFKGDFGDYSVSTDEETGVNTIEFNLKSAFVMSSAQFIASVANLVKTLISTREMFNSAWFKNTKEIKEEVTKPTKSNVVRNESLNEE